MKTLTAQIRRGLRELADLAPTHTLVPGDDMDAALEWIEQFAAVPRVPGDDGDILHDTVEER